MTGVSKSKENGGILNVPVTVKELIMVPGLNGLHENLEILVLAWDLHHFSSCGFSSGFDLKGSFSYLDPSIGGEFVQSKV